MSNLGRFIVVEGLEGAGKSTAVATIETYLAPRVPKVILTREPGGTPVGEAIRHVFKSNEKICAETELLLVYAARVQLVETVIKPALKRGEWVISDRFELSTWAYQGGGRGIDLALIQHMSQLTLNGFKPDYTFFLDISPEEGLKRASSRAKLSATTLDRIEQEPLAFFNAVAQGYRQAMTNSHAHVRVIDASQSLLNVQHQLQAALQQDIEI